jgi:hypothetical protein
MNKDGENGKAFFKQWAILATALALVLGGILIGQQIGEKRALAKIAAPAISPQRMMETATEAGSTMTNKTRSLPETFTIPESLNIMPSEWRTAFIGEEYSGYAALFEPQRQEVIVEQCRHPGYIDPSTDQPMKTATEFCSPVLWATLVSLDEDSAIARDRNGESVNLALAYSGEESGEEDGGSENRQAQLMLSFEGHEVTLVPGSKNDLFQEMERSPEMVKQKQRSFELNEAEYERQRREQSQDSAEQAPAANQP